MPAAKLPAKKLPSKKLAARNVSHVETSTAFNRTENSAEKELDALLKALSLACHVPLSSIHLIDGNHLFPTTNVVSSSLEESAKVLSTFVHTRFNDDAHLSRHFFEINDLTLDARFTNFPVDHHHAQIRFYAAIPLLLKSGKVVGKLCLFHTAPKTLTMAERAIVDCIAIVARNILDDSRLNVLEIAHALAEEALLEAADYTSSIFRNTKEPIIALALDGAITHWNIAAERIFGYKQTEVLGKNISILVPKDRLHEEANIAERIAHLPDGILYDTIRLNKQGKQIHVSVNLAPLYNGAGKLVGATKILHDIREQALTYQLLERNEAKYRALSDTSPLGVFSTDADGACTYTNARWQSIFGLNEDESLGAGWTRSIHHEDIDVVFKEWQRVTKERIEFDMEFRILHFDNTLRYVRSRARPMIDQDNAVMGFVGSVEDVTERRQTLEKLASSEERLRQLYQSTPAMLQSIDPSGKLISVSDLWLEKHGYTRDEVIGRLSTDFMTPESAAYARDVAIPMAMQQGHCEHIAYQKVTKSGKIFDVLLSSVIEHDAAGNPIHGMAVLVDVTEENAAKRSADELLGTIRTEFITSITDGSGNIIEVNDAFCAISQFSRAELLGANHRKVNSGYHPRLFFEEMWRTISQGYSWQGEICNRAKDGSLYWVSSVISPLKGNDGKIDRYISIRTDITKRKLAELAIIEQKQQIQQLIENQSVATFMIDAEHYVLHWNKACELLTGLSAETMLGKKEVWKAFYAYERPCLADLIVDNQKYEAKNYYQNEGQSALLKQGWHAEAWFDNMGGERRYVIFDAAPIFDSHGNITAAIETLQDVTASKLIEQAFKEEQQFLASVIEGTCAGTWQWNVATGECRFNEKWAQMIGYSLSEMGEHTFQTWEKRVYAEDLIKTLDDQRKHFAGETDMYETEFRMRHKTGRMVWVLSRGRVLSWTEDQKPAWMYGTHTDITERKQQEAALQKSQSLLDRTGRMAGVGGWEVDLTTSEVYWSDQSCLIHGVSPGYKPTLVEAFNAYPPEAQQILNAAYNNAINNNASWDLELPYIRADGQRIWVRSQGSVEYKGKEAVRVFGAFQDITERKQQEAALQKSQSFLDRTGRMAGVGGWEVDLTTNDVYWSDQSCLIHGVLPGYQPTHEEAISAYPLEAKKTLGIAFNDAIKNGTSWDLELPYIRADGQLIWVRTQGSVEFIGKKAVRVFGAFQDITTRIEQKNAIKNANERFELATRSGGIGIWSYDVINNIFIGDNTLNKLYGLDDSTALDMFLWKKMIHPDDRAEEEQVFIDAIKNDGEYNTEFRVIWPDGSVHYLSTSASITRSKQGIVTNIVGVDWDVTKLRQLALEVAEQHETLRVTLKSIGDAVITTDAKGRITWLNPVAERMTGWLSEEARKKPLTHVFNILNEETRKVAENPVSLCLKQGKTVGLAHHTILISRDGVEYGIEDSAALIRGDDGKVLGVVLVFHDVTEQRRLSSEMSYRATHDSLTGLVNRAEFESRLTRILKNSKNDDSVHALMFIDLDQFKLVNDACGHTAGDLLLQQVTKMLHEIVRSRDTLARLGGDEFGVILEKCTPEQAQRVAQSICDRMDDYRFMHDDKRFRIGTSIGLTVIDSRWNSVSSLMQAADAACFVAKEAGRNRVHTWFDTDDSVRTQKGEMQWATRLEQAIDENQFVLYAQRIYAVDENPTSNINTNIHAEVLIRLQEPNGKIIAPNAFLPAAERFHLASRIDRWVLQHVIAWMHSLDDLTTVNTICVNLSGQSIGDRAFHSMAILALKTAGDAICQRICLEVTETSAITNIIDASFFIEQVRSLGVRIALDDFGAGASSFGYLKTLKVDLLKIDGQFIKAMIHDPLDNSAVRCFVDVARIVKVKTVAEYVENTAILAHVKSLGIDYAQGYLLHKPAPLVELVQAKTQKV